VQARGRRGVPRPVSGDDETALIARRITAAVSLLGDDTTAAARVTQAPPGYLAVHDTTDVARHGALLSPVPAARSVRVVTTPGHVPGQWHLDVVARDRPGLLAAFTGVLADRGIDVAQAVLATWPDGAALEAFVVRSVAPPDTTALQGAFESSLER